MVRVSVERGFTDILAMLAETTAQVGPGLSVLNGPSSTSLISLHVASCIVSTHIMRPGL